jgi:hypothetical protein
LAGGRGLTRRDVDHPVITFAGRGAPARVDISPPARGPCTWADTSADRFSVTFRAGATDERRAVQDMGTVTATGTRHADAVAGTDA